MIRIALLLDFTEEYHKNLLKGIIRYAREAGPWAFLRIPVYYRETIGIEGVIMRAKDWGARGLIGQFHAGADLQAFQDAGIAVIAQDFEERFPDLPNISGAYAETGKLGAEYFLSKGYKDFAFYGFKNIVWSRERSNGFEKRIVEAGFRVHYFEHKKSRSMDLWYYKPSALSRWLKTLPKPVALMACDDNQALHITEACKHSGLRIPEDVAVLGVDNDENLCFLSDPSLSSIELDIERGGYNTAKLMEKMITSRRKRFPDIVIKPTRIITRASTDIYSTGDHNINKVLKYIHNNLEKDLHVENVVEQVPLSRRSLEKRFLQVIGMPVYKYIYNLRLKKFEEKLRETELTITEIAHHLGLGDTKNIARQFKQMKGVSPMEYRRKLKGKVGTHRL